MKQKTKLLLFAILALAAVLRFWQLGAIPASPDWDEASLGYNAYSILHTGKDEYGKPFPIILESFGDYKPALYVYLAIPPVAVFGLNVFSVRLPSAIFGVAAVLGVCLLIYELTKREDLALLSAFLLAVSPWHIQFSRVAFEANVGVGISIFAALFFLYGLKKNGYLLLSAACFGIELYAYQSDKVFAPCLFLLLVIIYHRKLFQQSKKYLIACAVVGLLVALPMILAVTTDSATLGRAASVSIFGSQSDDSQQNANKLLLDHQRHDTLGLILDNRRVLYTRQIIGNYISHWDLNWLYIKGDIPRHHAPGMGLLYLSLFPFLFIGLYSLIFGRYPKSMKFLLLFWFLLAPLPASITTGVPHAVRTMHFLPVITIIEAIGLLTAWEQIAKSKRQSMHIQLKYVVLALGVLLFVGNFFYYLDQYFVQLNYFTSEDWQYGYKQAVADINTLSPKYNKIVISNSGYLDQSYIFYLFYTKYPPTLYQKQMQFLGTSANDRIFGKFSFEPLDWQKEQSQKHVLYLGMPKEFPDSVKPLDTIHFLDGTPAIEIVGT